MQPKEALALLDRATSSLTVNRETHLAISKALQTLAAVIETRHPIIQKAVEKAETIEQPTVQ